MRPATRTTSRNLPPLLEPLESRTLLSVVLTFSNHFGPVQLPSPVASTAAPLFLGTNIHALSYQPFTAVLGTIRNLQPIPTGCTLGGQISWGDSTTTTPATFTHNPDGSISVLGSHDYLSPGTDKISITIAAFPPGNILAPVRLLGIINSTATVLTPNGGLTLQPTVHTPFTATLGTFRSNASLSNISATIDWGDGTTSTGKILALPVTDPTDPSTTTDPSGSPIAGGLFAVQGSHTYASLSSYLIKVTLVSTLYPSPTATSPTPPIQLVFQFDSIADVLPLLATPL